ncbi:MAG: hypothetical protein U0797_22830 [Gemmataceae bacterium]
MRLSHLTALAVLASPIASPAQESRFELGQRLRLFERELDRHTSAEVRKLPSTRPRGDADVLQRPTRRRGRPARPGPAVARLGDAVGGGLGGVACR